MNAPAQFKRILRRSETIVKLKILLRFLAEIACESLCKWASDDREEIILCEVKQKK
jgi:hypothetical protein